jgi:hypothetical protein
MIDFVKTNWKWIALAVAVAMILTGVWNEIAGVPHVQ